MSVASNTHEIKQGHEPFRRGSRVRYGQNKPFSRLVAVDPLTHVPYFDAFNVEKFFKPIIARNSRLERQVNSAKTYDLIIHSDMLKVRSRGLVGGYSGDTNKSQKPRGKVRGFARKSRKRMIELMASQRHGAPESFLTLTYPDEVMPFGQPARWKANLEAFRRRFEREYPSTRAIWRLELETRKSGRFLGAVAPHFHMVVWSVDAEILAVWAKDAWWEIVGSGLNKHREHGSHCSPIRSRKHAYWYVSKYVAKVESGDIDTAQNEVGRRWGRIGQFDTTESFTATMTRQEYVHFRRLVAGWMTAKRRDYAKRFKKTSARLGCTVFGLGDNDKIEGLQLLDGAWLDFMFHAIDLAKQSSKPRAGPPLPAWARMRLKAANWEG